MTEGQQKIALVSGGSRGIGRAICEELAGAGYYVIVNYRSGAQAAEETVRSCHELAAKAGITAEIRAEALQFDVASSDQVTAAVDGIKSRFGKIDVVVNNAGISKDGLLIRFKDEDWQSTLQTNLSGAFFLAREAAKVMIKARTGSIINISSVVGQMGNAGQAAYVSSKSGLIGLTKALSRELAARNITVNAIAPGFIETDMTAALTESIRAEHMKTIPLGRYGQADEIGKLVAFLAGDGARYITGQVIGVNGGMYM